MKLTEFHIGYENKIKKKKEIAQCVKMNKQMD